MKGCIYVKHRDPTEEIKFAVVTLQAIPAGFSPYFTLVGIGETINESNKFGYFLVRVCNDLAQPKMSPTVRMKSLTIFSGVLHILHHYKSNLAHLLEF